MLCIVYRQAIRKKQECKEHTELRENSRREKITSRLENPKHPDENCEKKKSKVAPRASRIQPKHSVSLIKIINFVKKNTQLYLVWINCIFD